MLRVALSRAVVGARSGFPTHASVCRPTGKKSECRRRPNKDVHQSDLQHPRPVGSPAVNLTPDHSEHHAVTHCRQCDTDSDSDKGRNCAAHARCRDSGPFFGIPHTAADCWTLNGLNRHEMRDTSFPVTPAVPADSRGVFHLPRAIRTQLHGFSQPSTNPTHTTRMETQRDTVDGCRISHLLQVESAGDVTAVAD
jgi:hypothetical protein